MGSDIFRLELPSVDIDRDGSGEEAAFNFRSFTLRPGLRTSLIVGDNVSDLQQLTTGAVEDFFTKNVTKYAIPTINGGTGQRTFNLSFTVADGHSDPTWGDAQSEEGTAANATGSSAFFRMQVLERYIAAVTEDSDRPAKISFGEYINGGKFTDGKLQEDGIEVVIENPEFTWDAPETGPSIFTGEMTFVETIDADAVVSARLQVNRDGT